MRLTCEFILKLDIRLILKCNIVVSQPNVIRYFWKRIKTYIVKMIFLSHLYKYVMVLH